MKNSIECLDEISNKIYITNKNISKKVESKRQRYERKTVQKLKVKSKGFRIIIKEFLKQNNNNKQKTKIFQN